MAKQVLMPLARLDSRPTDIKFTEDLYPKISLFAQLKKDRFLAGLEPEIHAITYTWRRMPRHLQWALQPFDDAVGSRPRTARFGHSLMLIARRPQLTG